MNQQNICQDFKNLYVCYSQLQYSIGYRVIKFQYSFKHNQRCQRSLSATQVRDQTRASIELQQNEEQDKAVFESNIDQAQAVDEAILYPIKSSHKAKAKEIEPQSEELQQSFRFVAEQFDIKQKTIERLLYRMQVDKRFRVITKMDLYDRIDLVQKICQNHPGLILDTVLHSNCSILYQKTSRLYENYLGLVKHLKAPSSCPIDWVRIIHGQPDLLSINYELTIDKTIKLQNIFQRHLNMNLPDRVFQNGRAVLVLKSKSEVIEQNLQMLMEMNYFSIQNIKDFIDRSPEILTYRSDNIKESMQVLMEICQNNTDVILKVAKSYTAILGIKSTVLKSKWQIILNYKKLSKNWALGGIEELSPSAISRILSCSFKSLTRLSFLFETDQTGRYKILKLLLISHHSFGILFPDYQSWYNNVFQVKSMDNRDCRLKEQEYLLQHSISKVVKAQASGNLYQSYFAVNGIIQCNDFKEGVNLKQIYNQQQKEKGDLNPEQDFFT